MYSNSYNYPPDSGSSQPGRGKVGGAGHTGGNENQFAGSVYGHGSSQNPAGQTYYPQQEMSRRPLQTMQVQNSQQMRPQHQMYHGPSQPLMYSSQPMDMYTPHDFERPHGFGRGYSEPTDFPPSQPYRQPGQLGQQGFGDVDMRFPGPGARRCQGHELQAYPQACPQDPPMLSRPLYPVGDMPVAGAGYAGVPAADRMYCDTPPSGYSGFTPSQTSTPITASGAAPATNSMCTSTSTGRGYPRASETASTANPQPPQQAPRQPGQQRQQRHVAAEVVPAVPVWTRPTPKVVKDEPNAPRGGPGGSRVVPLASVVKASTLSQPAAASQSPQSSSSRPMPSSAADKPRQPRQSGRATPNIDLGVRIITGTVENILDWGRKLSEEARPNILFEIVGSLDSVARGQWYSSQMICLRGLDNRAATVSSVFWEIDRPLSPPPVGSVVVCDCLVGPKLTQRQKLEMVPSKRLPRMQVLKMRAISAGQVAHYRRIAYVSSHAVSQGALAAPAAPADEQARPATPAPLKQTLISSYSSSKAARP